MEGSGYSVVSVVLLCVDSWESSPHLYSKWSWTLPFHFWKAISVRREHAYLPRGLGASTAYFSWSFPFLFPKLPCSEMGRYEKLPIRMPELHECVQRFICSALGWRCQRLPGRQRIGGLSSLDSSPAPASWWWSLSFHPVSSTKWGWLQMEVPFGLHLPPLLKGQIRSSLLLELIKWQDFSKEKKKILFVINNPNILDCRL